MPSVSSIYIYRCEKFPEYKSEEITDYIREIYPRALVEERGDFFSFLLKEKNSFSLDELAREITLCRVHNVTKEAEEVFPLPLEIEYEKKRLTTHKQLKGVIYDGFKFQALCGKGLNPDELSLSTCHIILTNQLLASFDECDRRYHLRVGIYGLPGIVSTSGIIEALAKPREYYLKLQMGKDALSLGQEFQERIISYEDSRITELLKGYCLQSLFYQIRGDLFCQDKNCRLYNAHWQEEALQAQIEAENEFCSKHAGIISQWKK